MTRLAAPFAAAALFLVSGPATPQTRVGKVAFIGRVTLPANTTFGGTQVGGLSGLTYDRAADRFYAVSDDRSSAARFYSLSVALGDGALTPGDVTLSGVVNLRRPDGTAFPAQSLDPEGIALAGGSVYVSSEGGANAGIQPFVNRFDLATGVQNRTLVLPSKFGVGTPGSGVRDNLALETLTLTPGGRLVTATENALQQDGPKAAAAVGSPSRILVYDEATGAPAAEYLYNVEPVPGADPPTTFDTNGLVDMAALDENTFLALERGLSVQGYVVRLYEVSFADATDISGIESLTASGTAGVVPVRKRLVLDLTSLGVPLGNLEGLALGPVLPGGGRALLVVSDNNFSGGQATQFLAFRVQAVVSREDRPRNGLPPGPPRPPRGFGRLAPENKTGPRRVTAAQPDSAKKPGRRRISPSRGV